MSVTGMMPGAGTAYPPQSAAGVALFDPGLPPGTVVPAAPARVDGDPLLVAGMSGFMLRIAANDGGVASSFNVLVVHCDPFTGVAILAAPVVTLAFTVAGADANLAFFGNNAGLGTSGMCWHTIRIGLSSNSVNPTLVVAAASPGVLYGGQR